VSLKVSGGCFSKSAKSGYVFRSSRHCAAVIRMSVVENPENAHLAGLAGSHEGIVSKETKAPSSLDIGPKHIHAHEAKARGVSGIKRAVIPEKVNVYTEFGSCCQCFGLSGCGLRGGIETKDDHRER